jgi:hypothetical protein
MRFYQSFFLALALLFFWNMPVLSAEKKNTMLESISFQKDALKREDISFKLDGEHIPKVYMIKGENPRIVLDFVDTRCSSLVNRTIETNGKLTKKIRVGIHNDPTLMTRVVVDLVPKGEYQYTQHFKPQDNTLLLSVFSTKADTTPEDKGQKEAKQKTADAPEAKKPAPLVQKGHTGPPQGVERNPVDKGAAKMSEKGVSKSPEPEKTAALKSPPDTPGEDSTRPPETKGMIPKVKDEKKITVGKEQTAVPEKEATDRNQKPEPLLSAVTFEKSSTKGEMIIFKLNGFFPPKVVGTEKGAPKVVCDFLNTRLSDQVKKVIHCKGRFVASVQVTQQKKLKKISVILSLIPNRNYDLQQVFFKEDNLFVIIVNSQDTLQMEKTTTSL